MGTVYPTFSRTTVFGRKRDGRCCLCGELATLDVFERTSIVKINDWVPWGRYREHVVQCPRCHMEYLTDPDLETHLVPSPNATRVAWIAWLLLIFPVVNIFMQVLALKMLPVTSNHHRQWAKIGLIPAILITGLILLPPIVSTIPN